MLCGAHSTFVSILRYRLDNLNFVFYISSKKEKGTNGRFEQQFKYFKPKSIRTSVINITWKSEKSFPFRDGTNVSHLLELYMFWKWWCYLCRQREIFSFIIEKPVGTIVTQRNVTKNGMVSIWCIEKKQEKIIRSPKPIHIRDHFTVYNVPSSKFIKQLGSRLFSCIFFFWMWNLIETVRWICIMAYERCIPYTEYHIVCAGFITHMI